jgi:hypothetical protein
MNLDISMTANKIYNLRHVSYTRDKEHVEPELV